MADRSKIEWTDASWNPLRARNLKTGKVGWHCEHATTGCEHCYSEGFNKRLGTGLPFKPGHRKDIEIFLDEEMLTQPLRWKKQRRVFVCSMTDAFAEFVTDEMLDRMFAVMALASQHAFQVLTKRSKRMREYFADDGTWERIAEAAYELWCQHLAPQPTGHLTIKHFGKDDSEMWIEEPMPNVWLGVSAERQPEADERIPDLCATPAAIRFVSGEPLLGPLDLAPWLAFVENDPNDPRMVFDENVMADGIDLEQVTLDWVIVGGESGRDARSMHPDWARALRDQCAAAKVAFFFKQFGEWAPSTPEDAKGNPHSGWMANAAHPHVARESELYPEAGAKFIARVGKQAAGRLLDGVEHNEFPRVPA
ncbi:DUF5131 family protein [Bradyrhizobium guangdongense]|uniref:DUF5131 family protein n=1 Tax=Bradyrhizobium guangdongense TaxID=1325090 RepID=UPI001319CA5D|nr:phage Gp37/Gp68 family protein [Bradyrhizobium guangdongense]